MRIAHRLVRLESARPRCDGNVSRIAGPDEPVDDVRDRCPRCGGCHVLVIEEVIVAPVLERPTDGGDLPCA